MAIINYKPTTNARRNMSTTDFSALSKTGPEKSLLAPKNKAAGRNSYGRITVRHRGGGNRKKYRVIDFKRQKNDMAATVLTLEYDPFRFHRTRAVRRRREEIHHRTERPEGRRSGVLR